MHPLDKPLSDLGFTVEVWSDDGNRLLEVLAAARNSSVATAAYEAALPTRPNAIVKLRQKALLVEARFPQGLPRPRLPAR
jgi:hypothetical protein